MQSRPAVETLVSDMDHMWCVSVFVLLTDWLTDLRTFQELCFFLFFSSWPISRSSYLHNAHQVESQRLRINVGFFAQTESFLTHATHLRLSSHCREWISMLACLCLSVAIYAVFEIFEWLVIPAVSQAKLKSKTACMNHRTCFWWQIKQQQGDLSRLGTCRLAAPVLPHVIVLYQHEPLGYIN